MSRFDTLLWLVIPYLAIATFIVGHFWRYRRDQFGWTSRSSELMEHKILMIGSPLFHIGLLAVIGGHVLGILVPESATNAVGISEHTYHVVAVAAGTASGMAMMIGFFILMARRLIVPRVRKKTEGTDGLTYTLLALAIITGMYATVVVNLFGAGYNYRETVGPWFRGFFTLNPQPELMIGIPAVYQIHAVVTFLLLALWPFSRLVHAWSVPIAYLRRPPILYRSRATTARGVVVPTPTRRS